MPELRSGFELINLTHINQRSHSESSFTNDFKDQGNPEATEHKILGLQVWFPRHICYVLSMAAFLLQTGTE